MGVYVTLCIYRYIICKYYLNKINVNNNDGTTLFLGHFGMGRFCTWAVFACGPFWDGPFPFGMTWYLGRLHLKARKGADIWSGTPIQHGL